MPSGFIKSRGRRKSNFPAKTSVTNDASVDFFSNGVNYKISFDDFKKSLGATGSLSQAGQSAAAPILQKNGPENRIRNIESGSGVKSSISAFNGVRLDHNFTVDDAGNPLLLNPSDTSPIIPSITAGTGISIQQVGNTYQVIATGTTTPTSLVIVNQESDFPKQDGSSITLESDKIYVVSRSFSVNKNFIVETGSLITSFNSLGPTLTYTGSDVMFSGSVGDVENRGFTIRGLRLSSPNASQTFNLIGVSSGPTVFPVLIIEDVIINATNKLGTAANFSSFLYRFCSTLSASEGFTISSVNPMVVLQVREVAVFSSSTAIKIIDLGSTVVSELDIQSLVKVAPVGSIALSGLPDNGNVSPGAIGTVHGVNCIGNGGALEGLSKDDVQINYSGVEGVPDTNPRALISIIGNMTQTIISAPSTDGSNAVKLNGVWTVNEESHFDADTTGRITYIGVEDITITVHFPVTILAAAGGDIQVSPYIVISGTVIQATGQVLTVSATKASSATLIWQQTLSSNDWVEIWLENQSGSGDLIGQTSVGSVND